MPRIFAIAAAVLSLSAVVLGAAALTGHTKGFEADQPAADDRPWMAHLRAVDAALQRGNVDRAVFAWHDAKAVALASSRDWEGLIAVGDEFLVIGRQAGTPRGAQPNARDAYLAALQRARRVGSIEGVLRSAEAFRGIGDVTVAEGCLQVAARMAASDERAHARIREARERWAAATSGS